MLSIYQLSELNIEGDSNFVLKRGILIGSISSFLKNRLDVDYTFENSLNIRSEYNNEEVISELDEFIVEQESLINLEIESATSYDELKESLLHMIEFIDPNLSQEERNALILLVNLQIIYTEFMYSNSDILQPINSANLISSRNASTDSWWSRVRKYAECAVSVVSTAIKGTLQGCVGLGALSFAVAGGISALPISAAAALEGCIIGGVIGGLAGAGVGAVSGGCFRIEK